MMDSNNFQSNTGMGEREGRVFSSLVSRRHFHLSHGIGRSGDLEEVQPKAAGSSILYKLCSNLCLNALHVCHLTLVKKCLVLPLATGMSIAMCLLALKEERKSAKYIIWSRIDQKSCFKSILTAGFVPLIVDTIQIDDRLCTDNAKIQELMQQYGEEVLCIFTTTSCFAPRSPDSVDVIAKLCQQFNIPHIINNAYGLQCDRISKLLNRAMTIGRVDYIISSTDKNFMVPVGGAIVYGPNVSKIAAVSKLYPGRASSSPIVDLFITLLAMGKSGLIRLREERNRLLPNLVDGLDSIASKFGERVLINPFNTISISVSLDSLKRANKPWYCDIICFFTAICA
jgi:O-phospho-L-seryl-tRNASec:L-selenocysteinyl-tRNA synthase